MLPRVNFEFKGDLGMADTAYKTLQKGTGESVLQKVKAEDAESLGALLVDKSFDETKAAHVAALADYATNMRSVDPAD